MKSSISSNFEVDFAIKYSSNPSNIFGGERSSILGVRSPLRDHKVSKSSREVAQSKVPCSFQVVSKTTEEEEAFDYVQKRTDVKTNNLLGSVAHLVKGTLGSGILGSHVAYMKAGIAVAVPLTVFFGLYIGYCMYVLVQSAQILCKRTSIPSMTYADVGEAAMCCFPNPKISRLSKLLRYYIDAVLAMTLFGSCACYQLIIAKSVKQLVEHSLHTAVEGEKGYLELRIYLLGMIIPIMLICLIRHLKYLAPFSIVGNVIILLCMAMAIYYAKTLNPKFENLEMTGNFPNFFEFTGMMVFGMSSATMVLPVENNMQEPRRFSLALSLGMLAIVFCTFTMAFFGYSAFLNDCDAPITVNFPMEWVPKTVKGLVAFTLLVNHGLSFLVLFNLCWVYIKVHHNQESLIIWEYFFRVLFVIGIAVLAITFPNIKTLMGFIGALCVSNLAFILPNIINLLVVWHRPGLGKYHWRLWRAIILMVIGVFCCVSGTVVNGRLLLKLLIQ